MGVLRSLIGVQVALAFLSLTGAGLFLRSLDQVRQVEPGFDASHLALLSFNLKLQGYDRGAAEAFYERALQDVAALPGVESAALAENRLLSGLGVVRSVIVEGHEPPPGQPGRLIRTNSITPEYFQTVSIPIVKGRHFNTLDRADSRPVAVVNQTMVDKYWPGQDPLGKRFRFAEAPDRFVEVVGVAADAKYGTLTEEPSEYVYLPLDQSFTRSAMLVARMSGPPSAWIQPVTSTVQELDSGLPLIDPVTGPRLIEDASWASRTAALLLLGLGAVSLFCPASASTASPSSRSSAVGHELGIRIALGAERANVLYLVLAQTGRIVLIGLGVGVALVVSSAAVVRAAGLWGVGSRVGRLLCGRWGPGPGGPRRGPRAGRPGNESQPEHGAQRGGLRSPVPGPRSQFEFGGVCRRSPGTRVPRTLTTEGGETTMKKLVVREVETIKTPAAPYVIWAC